MVYHIVAYACSVMGTPIPHGEATAALALARLTVPKTSVLGTEINRALPAEFRDSLWALSALLTADRGPLGRWRGGADDRGRWGRRGATGGGRG